MPRVPFNPKIGRIKTDAGNFAVDRSFLAHYHLTPAAADTDGIGAFTLDAGAQTIISGFNAIPEPRNVTITPSAAAVTGTTVKVYGVDFAGDAIDESFTTAGLTPKVGTKAFAAVTKVDLPVRGTTPAKQKATVAVTAGAAAAGTSVYTFTSAATGTAYTISCTYTAEDDTDAKAAVKLRAALNADDKFNEHWVAAGTGADITIERLTYAAHDENINLVLTTAGNSNVTLGSIAHNTVTGAAEDVISIGWGKVIGIPYKLAADELVIANLFNNGDDNGTVHNSATDLCSNTFAMGGEPNGTKPLDLYIIV
ncbi:MAG: hypothetical protein ACOX7H_08700 [Bacillota bacterium]|jgi:hypothetical protein